MTDVGSGNMLNEEQESSQSNSSNGSGAVPSQPQSFSNSGGFQLKSSILRQPATFGSGAGAGGGLSVGLFGSSSSASSGLINSFNLKPSVLKPSHFGGGFGNFGSDKKDESDAQNSSNSFGSNPFLKAQVSEEDPDQKPDDENLDKQENLDPLAKLKSSALPKSNLFANVKSISENSSGFVFGQNIHERVTGDNLPQEGANSAAAGLSFSTAATNNSNDSSSSNSTTPATANASADPANPNNSSIKAPSEPITGSTAANNNGGLEEAARKYEESRGALKRKFDEVETITGEENERNVIESNCKLFAFANSNWEERGHGMLRLNDKDSGSKESRLVFRQAGNLRVLINTKIWSGMTADQSSQKSLRLTAMDNNGQVKVFLVMSRPEIISKLHQEISERIKTAKKQPQPVDDLTDPPASDNEEKQIPPVAVSTVDDGDEKGEDPSPKKRLSNSSP